MIELLDDQDESDRAFRKWVDTLTGSASLKSYGWLIQAAGLVFTNYGHGAAGAVEDEAMLGVDPDSGDGTVKIVRPDVSRADLGKLTAVGRDGRGRLFLLRQGWLRPNNLSREVRHDFETLTGLTKVQVRVGGGLSKRSWFVVAELSRDRTSIVEQTVSFALACVRARTTAGGGRPPRKQPKPYSLGMDEKGRIITVRRTGGSAQVRALQGYVYEALKKHLGPALTKPKAFGYCVDGVVERAKLLLEIKTGCFAHDCYEAAGQLILYPSLVGLDRDLKRVLLLPDRRPLRPQMAAALRNAGIVVYTYSIDGEEKPKISFSPGLMKRCGA